MLLLSSSFFKNMLGNAFNEYLLLVVEMYIQKMFMLGSFRYDSIYDKWFEGVEKHRQYVVGA